MFPSTSASVSITSKSEIATRRGGVDFGFHLCTIAKTRTAFRNSREPPNGVLEAYKSKHLKDVSSIDLNASLKIFTFWGLEYDEFLKLACAYPPILDEDRNKGTQIFEMLNAYGFTKGQFKNLLLRHPSILKIDLENLRCMHIYLSELLQMSSEQFVKMASKRPRIIMMDSNSLEQFCNYFLETLPLEPFHVAKMITRQPSLLDLSCESNLKPKLEFFLSEIGISRDGFAKRVKQQPNVLGLSLANIKERILWMKKTFDYTDADLQRLCSSSLTFILLGRPLLESKIENLCGMFDFDRKRCGLLLKHYPHLLTLSVQNINETFNFITQEMNRDVKEVIRNPALLWNSIEKRIRPRYELLRKIDFPEHNFPLSALYCSKNDVFQELLERHESENAGNPSNE